jgi:preprotein translocase subunit SecG
MSFIIGILTFFLVANCFALALLVLVQLPKKDAGAGLAFGGGAADAVFGAGSGNALTKITKWATVSFILLAVILGSVESQSSRGNQSEFEQAVEQQQQTQSRPAMQPSPTAPAQGAAPQSTPPAGSTAPSLLTLPTTTNAPPAMPTTNGK